MVFPCFWKESWSAAIVNHLWQSTLVILIAWMLTLVLRRNPARVRYVIWMAASLKLLVPFSMLTAIGEWLHPSSTIPVPVPPITGAMVQITHPFFGIARETFSLSSGASGYMAGASSPASQQHLLVPEVLCLLWLCGCFFLLLRWSRAWLAIRAAVRSASQTSLLSDVPVFSTRSLMEPGIVGIFRPVMLLPEKALDLPSAQLNTILAHECFHNRRHDNLTAAMHMLVEAIFWFHPAVWWIERRLIEERERACDEAVLQHGNEAAVYAETILNVCKFCAESPIPCVSGVTGAELKQRILRIMTNQVVLPLNLSRRVLLVIIATAAISTPVLFGLLHISEVLAQSAPISPTSGVVATWQGILHTDRDLHFVFKITRSNGATLHTAFYNLDAPPAAIPAISTTFSGSQLKLELPFATYSGTLSPDGNSITGTWNQGQTSLPLHLARTTSDTAWTIPQAPAPMKPMASNADPSFEVATIKPSRPEEHGPRYDFRSRRFSVIHASLSDLLKFSYGLQQSQISKVPDWVNSENFDISAEPDGNGEPSIQQWESMVKKLIADRFQLKFHFENQEQNVYLLTVGKNGPKLTRSQSDPDSPGGMGFGPPGNFGATNATTNDIANALGQGVLNRPVVDQTGLTGRFDLRLRWTPDGPAAATEGLEAPPEFFTAIQEQLGLKVVSAKAPVKVLVIDRVTKPSAN